MVVFFKKANLLEMLTILFFISVGISLTYKIGFYNTIGADWYIQNLSPQQLFISSFRVSLASIVGVAIGCYLGFKLKYKAVEIITYISFVVYVVGRWVIGYFFSEHQISINLEIILFILNTLAVMFMITLERDKRNLNSHGFVGPIKEKQSKAISNFDGFLKILFLFLIIFAPYTIGCDKGRLVNKNAFNSSFVKIKDDVSNWQLIDMNGDKILLKKCIENEKIFKLVEYKEIIQITSQVDK